jgi:hypothetical protein
MWKVDHEEDVLAGMPLWKRLLLFVWFLFLAALFWGGGCSIGGWLR